MANTYTSLHIHVVFSTKYRERVLDQKIRKDLWPYMGGIAKENRMIPIAIGGVEDHSHLLLCIPPALSVSKGIQIIKTGSSRWIHDNFKEHRNFAWQVGYGAFTVSPGRISRTVNYIHNQERHHYQATFQEEYLRFLRESGVEYDERYLWG
jgi:REP element-mobilizing transposase RayT